MMGKTDGLGALEMGVAGNERFDMLLGVGQQGALEGFDGLADLLNLVAQI